MVEKSLKKHVAIIHAYALMSTLQRKIVNVLLYEALEQNIDSNNYNSVSIECRIPFSNIIKAINFTSNNTQYIKEAIDDLASLKIEWNLLKDKVPTDISFLNLRILHGAPTFYHDKTINFSFHKVLIDLLKKPSIYGTVDLEIQSCFESKYSHSLYENSTRFVNLKKNKIIQLETFRKLLGVSNDKYQNMREFNRNVIYPSIEEVNDRADFILDLKGIKAGRKILAFEISVNNKSRTDTKQKKINPKDKREDICNLISKLFGEFNPNILDKILTNYSDKYILEKIDYCKKYAKVETSGFYPIPYFISALRDNYKLVEKNSIENSVHYVIDEWGSKFDSLQNDLSHWKKMLEYARSSKNSNTISVMEKAVQKCEVSLEIHLKSKKQGKAES